MSSKKVCYVYDPVVGSHYYGAGHPMKPKRLDLTNELVASYGLYRRMDVIQARPAETRELTKYHSQDYVKFLERVSPSILSQPSDGLISSSNSNINRPSWVLSSADQGLANKYNVGEQTDCPLFDGLFDFCRVTCGASLEGARRLNAGLSQICINWSGGLHHAKKAEASGFCYMNDIILAILELLRYHARVLYIDIDIHHGDGVEDAFYHTDRVMTCSFHKYGDFFPGTGDVSDIGQGLGERYSVNFPLKSGLDDASFERIFKPVIQKIMDVYDPGCVVLQCGADSLAGDRLGVFDLSVEGHAACVRFVKSFQKPLLVLGGGGYTIANVARCWAYETAVLCDADLDIPNQISPQDPFYDYYAPSYTLHGLALDRVSVGNTNGAGSSSSTAASGGSSSSSYSATGGGGGGGSGGSSSYSVGNGATTTKNTREYLENCTNRILRTLDQIKGAPSVSIQEVPPSFLNILSGNIEKAGSVRPVRELRSLR